MYYKFPNAHQPMQNYLPTGGQVPLTHWVGAWPDWSRWIRQS